jgi:hypothetical protein
MEAVMKTLWAIPAAAALLMAVPVMAQTPAQDPVKNAQDQHAPGAQKLNTRPTSAAPNTKSGTTATGNAATGWSGPDQEKAQTSNTPTDANASEYATGLDLKGPPVRFAPNKTPE